MQNVRRLIPWFIPLALLAAAGCSQQTQTAQTHDRQTKQTPRMSQQHTQLNARLVAATRRLDETKEELSQKIRERAVIQMQLSESIKRLAGTNAERHALQKLVQGIKLGIANGEYTQAEIDEILKRHIEHWSRTELEHSMVQRTMPQTKQRFVQSVTDHDQRFGQLLQQLMYLQVEVNDLQAQVRAQK